MNFDEDTADILANQALLQVPDLLDFKPAFPIPAFLT
jgi:hypothetical protein